MKHLAVCLMLMSLIYTVSCLSCKSCMYLVTDNEQINDVLDMAMSSTASDQMAYGVDCKDYAHSVLSMSCSSTAGSCIAMKISAKFDNAMLGVNMEMYFRACEDNVESDGCRDIQQYEDEIREQMGPAAGMMTHLAGTACTCSSDDCNTLASEWLRRK